MQSNESEPNHFRRIFLTLVWFGCLLLAGLTALLTAASRVGEQRSSTFGAAYEVFRDSWGGEISVRPPDFAIHRRYKRKAFNKDLKRYEYIPETEEIKIIPGSVLFESTIDYGEQERGWLVFNAFESEVTQTYEIRNTTGRIGPLYMRLETPEQANLMHDFSVRVDRSEKSLRPVTGQSLKIAGGFAPNETRTVTVHFRTKGMDVFKYELSRFQKETIGVLRARIILNTGNFSLYRFGLPHTRQGDGETTRLSFDMEDFTTSQDLGITFLSRLNDLDQIQTMLSYSPISLLLFLGGIFVFVQVRGIRVHAFHFLFVAISNVFYFLFITYLVRFLSVGVGITIALVLSAVMFLAFFPNVFGRRFSLRIALPYMLVCTLLFSLTFLMPIFRGLSLVCLLFGVFLAVMIPISRSKIADWPLMTGET